MIKHGMRKRINIQETIEKTRKQLADEPNLSPALKATLDMLIDLCLLLSQNDSPKLIKQQHPAVGRPEPGKSIKGQKKTRRTDPTSGDSPEAGG
jgi:hypothetical protein